MRVMSPQLVTHTIVLVAAIALGGSNSVYAQRGGRGGGPGGGHGGGGGHAGGNAHGGGGNAHVSPNNGTVGGGHVQGHGNNTNPGNWNSGQSSNRKDGNRSNGVANGNSRTTGNQGNSLARIYGAPGGGGYRGYVGYPYGRFGLGPAYGPYGYGYFPWYGGVGLYGGLGGLGRIFGNGIYGSGYYNSGYYGGDTGYGGTTVYQQPQQFDQPQQRAEDYVPQVNTTSAKLAAGAAGNAVLGVTIDPAYPAAAVISRVTPGAPAETVGLRPGDMIATINERVIQSPDDVVNLVRSMRPGDRVDIQFVRPIPRSQVKAAAPEIQPGATAPPAVTETLPPAPPALQPTPAS